MSLICMRDFVVCVDSGGIRERTRCRDLVMSYRQIRPKCCRATKPLIHSRLELDNITTLL